MDYAKRLVIETEGQHGANIRGWNGEEAQREAEELERREAEDYIDQDREEEKYAGLHPLTKDSERLQIQMAAKGCISGTLAEWPLLSDALAKQGCILSPNTPAGKLRKICKRLMSYNA